MKQLKIFINLTRLNKPIGFMLLFWPCSWGLAYAYFVDKNLNNFLYHLLLFFIGSVLMRSAGCIFNDIVDKNFDKKVTRTKLRPIANRRANGVMHHEDWDSREFHKKCWKKLKNDGTLDDSA